MFYLSKIYSWNAKHLAKQYRDYYSMQLYIKCPYYSQDLDTLYSLIWLLKCDDIAEGCLYEHQINAHMPILSWGVVTFFLDWYAMQTDLIQIKIDKIQAWFGFKLFNTLMLFLIEIFTKFDFENNPQNTKKPVKLPAFKELS